MEVSFGTPMEKEENAVPAAQAAVSVDKVAPSTAVAIRNDSKPALSDALRKKFASLIEGDAEHEDVARTYFGIAQGTGDLTEKIGLGKFHYNAEVGLGTQVKVVFLAPFRKYFLEDLSDDQRKQEPDRIPKKFKTLEDAKRAGYSLEADRGDNKIVRAAQIDLYLVVDSKSPIADMSVGEYTDPKTNEVLHFVPATWNVKKGAYRNVVPVLVRDSSGWLRGNVSAGYYSVSITKESYQKNSWYEPTLKAAGRVPPEVTAIISGNTTPA